MAGERMSLIDAVTALVKRAGRASVDDILPDCHGHTRKQVLYALRNASMRDLVHWVAHSLATGKRGKQPGIYAPGPGPMKVKPAPRIVRAPSPLPKSANSVFQLGAMASKSTGYSATPDGAQ